MKVYRTKQIITSKRMRQEVKEVLDIPRWLSHCTCDCCLFPIEDDAKVVALLLADDDILYVHKQCLPRMEKP